MNKIAHIFILGTMMVALSLFTLILGEISYHGGFPSQLSTSRITGLVVGPDDVVRDGFAQPYDRFDNNVPLVGLSTVVSGQNINVNVQVDQVDGFIYRHGYILRQGVWHQFTFNTPPEQNSNWIANSATYLTSLPSNEFLLFEGQDDFYVAVYTCKQYDGVWRCGCLDAVCDDNFHWLLQSSDLGEPFAGKHIAVQKHLTTGQEFVVSSGETFHVNVIAYEGNAVYGFDFDLEWDNEVLRLDQVNHGGLLGLPASAYPGNGTNPATSLCVEYDDSQVGVLRNVACTAVGAQVPVGNSIIMKSFQFTALSPGYSQIRATSIEVAEWPDVATDGSQASITSWDMNPAAVIVLPVD